MTMTMTKDDIKDDYFKCIVNILLVMIPMVLINYNTNGLNLLVVMFHEISHLIVTIITGGEYLEFAINKNEGGYVLANGGDRFLQLSSGYLGATIIGCVLLYLSFIAKNKSIVVQYLSLSILIIGYYISDDLFTLEFATITGIFLFIISLTYDSLISAIALRIISIQAILYSFYDIYSDTILYGGVGSDAYMLSKEYYGTSPMWGFYWIIIASIIIVITTLLIIVKTKKR
jgi:hypothetical protein